MGGIVCLNNQNPYILVIINHLILDIIAKTYALSLRFVKLPCYLESPCIRQDFFTLLP